MSRYQRDKGARFERECVVAMNDHQLDAERNLSQCRDGKHDIDSLAGAFECKKRGSLPAYLKPAENVRGVFFAEDNGERLVVVRREDYLKLLKIQLDALTTRLSDGQGITISRLGPQDALGSSRSDDREAGSA